MKQKYPKKDGTVSIYELKNKKWIYSNKPYKPQKRGLEKKSIWSSRFGFLELYSRKEQQALKCPSGYSIGQCFNIMHKMWFAYHKAQHEGNIERMEKYAKAVQAVQKDMGIKTTSFPHLGIYGDVFILNNKQGERVVFEDHSALKEKQEAYEKWQAENAKKIQAKVLRPNKEKGEEIVSFADDVSPGKKYEVENEDSEGYLIPDVLQADEEEGDEDSEGYLIPDVLQADEEEGEERITITDDIPFRKREQG